MRAAGRALSSPAKPDKAVLVVAALAAPSIDLAAVESELREAFGPIDLSLPFAPFEQTKYYESEMGEGLVRGFYSFGAEADPGSLWRAKTMTNGLESKFAGRGKRAVNLDPGILTLTNLVLASGKPAAHRVYLDGGIYAEIEYLFRFGGFTPLEWTYPDYRDGRTLAWFNEVRERLRQRRRAAKC